MTVNSNIGENRLVSDFSKDIMFLFELTINSKLLNKPTKLSKINTRSHCKSNFVNCLGAVAL